jgi:hypothetical protein
LGHLTSKEDSMASKSKAEKDEAPEVDSSGRELGPLETDPKAAAEATLGESSPEGESAGNLDAAYAAGEDEDAQDEDKSESKPEPKTEEPSASSSSDS